MCARQAQTLHQLTLHPILTAPLLESMHGFLKVDPLEVVLCNNGGRGEVTASDTRRAGDYFTFAGNIPMEKLSVQKKNAT